MRSLFHSTRPAGAWLGALWILAMAGGCADTGWAEVSGNIAGVNFNNVHTVYHGHGYIILFDRAMDCLDVAFVDPVYTDGQNPSPDDFVALQFYFSDGAIAEGTFSVAGDSAVGALGLLNDGPFVGHRGRDGTLTISEATEDIVEGQFTVEFGEGGVGGSFSAIYCRNLR